MKLMVVAVSSEGFQDAGHNDRRTEAVCDLLRSARRPRPSIVHLPAGFWTVDAEKHVLPFCRKLAKSLGKYGCWIVGGVDSREGHRRSKAGLRKGGGHPTKDSRRSIDQLVRRNALPFWGFAISPRGRIHGPWRQISTASENATYAPTNVVEAIARRNLDVDGLAVLPLVCGEMHSRPIRTRVKEISPHLVLVSGHASHKRAVQGIRTVYNASGAAVVHTQHLVPSTGGAHHWINARGRDFAESMNRSKKDLGSPDFWLSGKVIAF